MRALVPLCVLLVASALLPAAAPAAVTKRSGVVYGSGASGSGDVRLRLDLYRPSRRFKGRRPVVVLIHGGGFRAGRRDDANISRVARGFAARGTVAVSIDYRLQRQDPRPSAPVRPLLDALPDQPRSRAIVAAVDDTLTAIDYLRRNARKLRIDARRLGLVGSSAGAVTADHVAYTLDDHGIRGRRIRFVGSLWGGILVSPGAAQLERGEPALFAHHGDADRTVPVQLSDRLVERARAQRVRREYHRVAGAGHGYPGSRFFTAEVRDGQTSFGRLLRFGRLALR